ncbi:MAG TPA: PP2C family protein-serine/threonine phosphatase [Thermoanaerobaculia bacterium]|nr:PP2C family protein-serine/threonine phosphatase [Thermoanaerobaculia bacterium]
MKTKHLLAWLLLGAAGLVALLWAHRRAYPTVPHEGWTINRGEAIEIALEKLRDLGEPLADPYVEATLSKDVHLERRLRLAGSPVSAQPGGSRIIEASFAWEVKLFAPGARPNQWTYRAEVSPEGHVTTLSLQVPREQELPEIDPALARQQADELLRAQGFDLARFDEPQLRSSQATRTDRTLRYRERGSLLGEGLGYGVEVTFAGDRLTGYNVWFDDPDAEAFGNSIQLVVLGNFVWRVVPILLFPFIAIFFVRRYHAGEIGIRRGVQILVVVMVASVVASLLCAGVMSAGTPIGPLTRQQVAGGILLQILVFFFFPMGALAMVSWSVGEVLCREKHPWRLAGFDAFCKLQWDNATVARDTLRGVMAGVASVGLPLLFLTFLEPKGVWSPISFSLGPWADGSSWLGLAELLLAVAFALYAELFARLLLVSALVQRLGTWGGGAVAVVFSMLLLFPNFFVLPFTWWVVFALGLITIQVFLFLRYGLLTSLFANLVSTTLFFAYPFLASSDPWQQGQGALAAFVPLVPMLLSLRQLQSGREFVYRYEDVPPHVRRIAERERQRVELEMARRIQSSILPDLPPQLNGVELAHSYLPATEVGGDFYDVLALEDGRLAVALGDVAGHGVSSGLVMSMARSALAVQVTFDPAVASVFATLNRVVYQSARKRLLATLCYAVLDPKRRELEYASAGHLYPYVISKNGAVHPLAFEAYPLGVRSSLTVEARLARLEEGDTLFLLSDGVVEARAEGSDELFGFDRLEQSLRTHSHLPVGKLRDAVLADVARHSRHAPREDDQTVLVLRLP